MLTITLDAQAIARIEAAMKAAQARAPDAIRRAVNWTGERTRTKVVRALTKQTGLKRRTIDKAVKPSRANYGSSAYIMRAAGGNVALKYFGARETRAGVSAAPWGHRRVFAGTFMKGGLFPNRRDVPGLHGQVFMRAGSSRLPIAKQKSGLFIPVEMVKGESEIAFNAGFALLPGRVEHEVAVILSGVVR